MNFRSCNICNSKKTPFLLYNCNSFDIVRCSKCGLVFVNNIPDEKDLANLYSRDFFSFKSKYGYYDDSTCLKPHLLNSRRRIEAIRRYAKGNSLLDIGCATGNFLNEAAKHWRVCGSEISPYASNIAMTRGFDVVPGDFANADFSEKKFDIVTMWDYLEHVQDPKANIKKVFGLLNENGLLVLSTGDIDSLTGRAFGRNWHLMTPPRHLYFFSEKTITALLADCGFKVIELNKQGRFIGLDMILYKISYLHKGGYVDMISAALNRTFIKKLFLYINFRDIMTVFAKKGHRP